jgi:hypothetical protein
VGFISGCLLLCLVNIMKLERFGLQHLFQVMHNSIVARPDWHRSRRWLSLSAILSRRAELVEAGALGAADAFFGVEIFSGKGT